MGSLGVAPRHRQGLEDPQARSGDDAAEARRAAGHHLQGTDRRHHGFGRPSRRRRDPPVAGRPRAPRANREIIVEPRNSVAALVAKFRGRLFVLGDIDAVPGLTDEERAEFLATLNRAFDGKVEAIGWGHDGPAIRRMLKANALPHQEAFLVGAGMGHQVLGEAAGLPLTKDIESWFASP